MISLTLKTTAFDLVSDLNDKALRETLRAIIEDGRISSAELINTATESSYDDGTAKQSAVFVALGKAIMGDVKDGARFLAQFRTGEDAEATYPAHTVV